MNKQIESIQETYNRDELVEAYTNAVDHVGLWNSEKIIFSKYITKKSKILDLGCGAGRTTINLYKKGYQNITGLDISDRLINFAQNYCDSNNLDIEFIQGSATDLDFADDNEYDAVIFSYNGMQCIPGQKNRDNVLKEVYRVLKPGGVYIFTAHNRDDSIDHQELWNNEKKKWNIGVRDTNLEIFGDIYTTTQNGERVFIHFSSLDEMKEFVTQENFQILEYKKREDICEESEKVKAFSGSTWFWVLQKLD